MHNADKDTALQAEKQASCCGFRADAVWNVNHRIPTNRDNPYTLMSADRQLPYLAK